MIWRCVLVVLTHVVSSSHGFNFVLTGGTGRVGQRVVEKLLDHDHKVVVLTRNASEASMLLPTSVNLEIKPYDIASLTSSQPCKLIHCANDVSLLPAFTDTFPKSKRTWLRRRRRPPSTPPSITLLSSAGVTRPSWSQAKAKRLPGAADIPIVRLNPGDILNVKFKAEEKLRRSHVPYSIVRPVGLKDSWPSGRPIFSQNDVAVGRINLDDLASVLIATSLSVEATGKTFEAQTLTGYLPPKDYSGVLSNLALDGGEVKDESYNLLQQLLPGEEQDATKLEMGRSYEEVDSGKVVARQPEADPTEREKQMARSVEEQNK